MVSGFWNMEEWQGIDFGELTVSGLCLASSFGLHSENCEELGESFTLEGDGIDL